MECELAINFVRLFFPPSPPRDRYAVILAFDVKIERDAQEMADSVGVRIFQADIIYHLFDRFTQYRDELKQKKRDEFKSIAVFPCKLRIIPEVGLQLIAGTVFPLFFPCC